MIKSYDWNGLCERDGKGTSSISVQESTEAYVDGLNMIPFPEIRDSFSATIDLTTSCQPNIVKMVTIPQHARTLCSSSELGIYTMFLFSEGGTHRY